MTSLDKLTDSELIEIGNEFRQTKPFNHLIIDNFLDEEIVNLISSEFPSFEDPLWSVYNNPLEIKKLTNHWNNFGPTTYRYFQHVLSSDFNRRIELILFGTNQNKISSDFGLNGGGLHTHKSHGKLNPHLDYNIHPKLKLQRVANLIVYITPDWQENWGGSFGLWEHNAETNNPGKLSKKVAPLFNRAVIFNTTQNSWHGICDELNSPENKNRSSLATYYLAEPIGETENRMKAKFAPTEEQIGDKSILDLIEKRQSMSSYKNVYEIK